ncbi:MAG: saccharopine dehydrogenase NADP-binding domain-containing protein [Spirochaetaceae bacterium]|nr:MAG: saccharopine dehydrogenase NADP-binding domain-containing protein [Spirochaetaceae bacterium]
MKKVFIVGAGAQATVLCGVLSQAEEISRIVLTDINPARAGEIAETNGSGKIAAETIDASDIRQLTARMKAEDFDLVINATIPMFVRQVLQAAYNARIDYLDMASNEIYPEAGVPIEQLAYAEQWEKAGLRCLTGGGGDPGLTNIMAKDAVLELEEVDSIRIKDFGIVECDRPVALWSMRTYLEDLYLPATIWEAGKPKQVPPFSGMEDYEFPPPLGVRGRCYFHDHEETVTIPLFCGKPVKYCDFKIGEPDIDTWKFLIQGLGLMDEKPVEIGGCRVSPREILFQKIPETASPKKQIQLYDSGKLNSRLMLLCDVVGIREGRKLSYKLWTESPDGNEACQWIKGANDVSWLTSVPASIFALMLLRSQVKHTGVFPPEVFDREEIQIFYRAIQEWGIRVIKQIQGATA